MPPIELNKEISFQDFNDFYWSKEQLTVFCRQIGISTLGGKIEISDRIRAYLSSGTIVTEVKRHRPTSRFDWNTETLTLITVVTDNYKNSENVREFMKEHIGSHFRYNTAFMQWTKQNIGKPLADAIAEWQRLEKSKGERKTEIAPQFEYNTYIREFTANNPDRTIKDAITFWKKKRDQRGDNKYSESDLLL